MVVTPSPWRATALPPIFGSLAKGGLLSKLNQWQTFRIRPDNYLSAKAVKSPQRGWQKSPNVYQG
jgi:hypothetical protein